MGALSKLDDFLLNPQVRTCYVAVPGTSKNSNSENWEPTGDRSPNDRCPEVVYSASRTGNLRGFRPGRDAPQSHVVKWQINVRKNIRTDRFELMITLT